MITWGIISIIMSIVVFIVISRYIDNRKDQVIREWGINLGANLLRKNFTRQENLNIISALGFIIGVVLIAIGLYKKFF